MEQHVTILGALYIAFSILGILAGVIVFTVMVGSGLISGDDTAIGITSVLGTVIGLFLFVISVPGIIGGVGLLKKKEWARILVLVLGFINLINIPFGTILGIYTIWALMKPEVVSFFTPASRAVLNPSPPGPVAQ
jgi:hypothetical protein